MLARRARALVAAVGVAGCVHEPPVERAYGDHSVDGRHVEPGAYAAFLRGVLAEAAGDTKGALASYAQAADLDPDALEVWTHLGALRCAAVRSDSRADQAFARALALDPDSGRAWAAKAQCALSRGDEATARVAAARAAALDPGADEANVLLASKARPERDGRTRTALVALTLTASDRVLAWETLAAWAEAHGDVALQVRALGELARFGPAWREAAAGVAERLAAGGRLTEARSLAAAAADAGESPMPQDRHPLAARLAVDEAIARGDEAGARERATRTRVSLEEVAGRAALSGQVELGRAIAAGVADADPGALGARLVLAASEGRDAAGAARRAAGQGGTPISAAALVAFAGCLVHSVTPDDAHASLSRLPHDPIVPGDARVLRRAVELVSCGALDEQLLPPEAAADLARARGQAAAALPCSPRF